ncbi:hypothetical protein CTH30272_00066 [Allocatenococcus thiocycli]|nr:hypothetical protein CTH30272_00066 [Catenococcus thiocycli]
MGCYVVKTNFSFLVVCNIHTTIKEKLGYASDIYL